jgi:hypothetical protein
VEENLLWHYSHDFNDYSENMFRCRKIKKHNTIYLIAYILSSFITSINELALIY